jgi:hypothetical protein
MSRFEKRLVSKELAAIAKKAKKAMASWMAALGYTPSVLEVSAWQAGYIAGVNSVNKND